MTKTLTSEEYQAALEALSDEYPHGSEKRTGRLSEYYTKRAALSAQWREGLRQAYAPGLSAEAFEFVFNYAFAEGHADGLRNVEYLISDLVDLVTNVQRVQEGER